jgi:very-short-patch-repair endonuclease
LTFHQALTTAITGLASTLEGIAAIKRPLESLLGEGNPLLGRDGPVAGAADALLRAEAAYGRALDAFSALASATSPDLDKSAGETPDAVTETCRGILPLERRMNLWCAWRKTRNAAMARGLAPLVDAVERGAVAPGRLREAFETGYCRWWLDAMVDGDEVLRSFVSAEQDKRIADFRALDDRFTELTRAYVRANLCAELPAPDGVTGSSEWGVLRREMQKQRSHMPLRELLGRLPTATAKLAPCLLMSPLSIAQFLAADTAPFDVVVFDEASQIPVWDAIGAIARGRQVVMVGDPKQLPPTAFFDRAEAASDEDSDVEGDLESILDECLGANLPVINLSWHYRSRHESLIAFSNHRYYEGGLVTFPSPVTDDRAVSFHHVADGVYEKGGARINKPEARALVDDLVARLKDPDFRASKLTAGVVTFNSEQQKLIEDLLDEARRKSPDLEQFFAEDVLEPVFVKNLENVQGDERDIIYFSITYGPDRSGAVSMNFGPMNKTGGERRLNVAITRARHGLRVFSSLRPEQFDLSRTSAEGVRDLKHFLEFAERGPRAIAEAVRGSIGGHDSPFEAEVARALAARGWQVHPQVGVSVFRIDLGVVDPDAPGRYLTGIECDGATYHRSATARDRDKLREQVLRGLGWEIVRIWSTDWWHDHDSALEKVETRLRGLLEASRARRAEEEARRLAEAAAAAAAPEMPSEEIADAGEDGEDEETAPDGTGRPSAEVPPFPTETHRPADDLFQGADLMVARAPSTGNSPAAQARKDHFREADPASVVNGIDADAFYASAYDARLIAMIEHVAAVEGPVRDDVLAKRIARAHGWARTGPKIRDRIMTLVRGRLPMSQEETGLFIWASESDITGFPAFRRPTGLEARPIDEIAMPELATLAREVLAMGIIGEAAVAAMARETGFQRLRAVNRERLERALALANFGNER